MFNNTFEMNMIELHQRNQSKMNHKWKYSNLQYAKPNVWQDSFLVSSTHKTIKTRKYNCNELNTVQVTKCLDEFYMKELNCSFPWLQTEFMNLPKCWSKHYIDDLKTLIKNVSKVHGKHSEKVENCLIPNCLTTNWKTSKHFNIDSKDKSWFTLIIDSSMVKKFKLYILILL